MKKILQMLMPGPTIIKMVFCITPITILGWLLSANVNFYIIALLAMILVLVIEIEDKLNGKN
jgi:hypothetical protein